MSMQLTEKSRVSLPFPVLYSVLALAVGLTAGAFGMQERTVAAVRTERAETLKAYVTREELLDRLNRIDSRLVRIETLLQKGR